ncbi:MAG: FAD-dependent oxidoreductase [Sphingopyxis sp.]|uniref:FAD-dependent oxidoreductase n=1 Tax=Sphingopyxis sp. TaxID=1908224 RepID=UPI003D80AFCE
MPTLPRRHFVAATAALALPGCAVTTARTPPPSSSCLAPVKASPDRVIRTAAGLRPYRPGGFVVRADALGAKRLVHNYGHGGAGITMSWGTSKLAVDMGIAGFRGAAAVIGAGVMGLSTARLLQEAGFAVTIYAKALPPETTSNIAGGQFHPYSLYRDDRVTPEWRRQFSAALDYSWRRFQIMIGDDYGVRWLTTYAEGTREAPILPTFPPAARQLGPDEHPFPVERLWRYDTIYVETGRYLNRMQRDFQTAGGRIVVREFAAPAEIGELPETLVFNCTGLGSHGLFGDTELVPIRGQLAMLIPQPEIDYAFTGEAGYMFPRPDGIVLGGSYERNIWEAEVEPERIARIVASHRALFAGFRCPA